MLGCGADVFHQAGFGDFQFQAAWRQAVHLQQVVDHPWQFGVVQLNRGQVDRHAQVTEALVMPLA
ncbi:hypothetical protein D3C75_1175400 [compost metagenome]